MEKGWYRLNSQTSIQLSQYVFSMTKWILYSWLYLSFNDGDRYELISSCSVKVEKREFIPPCKFYWYQENRYTKELVSSSLEHTLVYTFEVNDFLILQQECQSGLYCIGGLTDYTNSKPNLLIKQKQTRIINHGWFLTDSIRGNKSFITRKPS